MGFIIIINRIEIRIMRFSFYQALTIGALMASQQLVDATEVDEYLMKQQEEEYEPF